MDQTYANTLKQYITQPGSYEGSPGFKFALDTGLDAVSRSAAARGLNGSGNMMAQLLKTGIGTAQQDYGATIDRLGRLSGQEEQYGLGQTGQDNQLALGHEANANTRRGADQSFGLGMYRAGNDYSLGADQNATNRERNLYDYSLGGQKVANDAAANANTFAINNGRNAIDWFGANTNRGAQQSEAWLGDQKNQRDWYSIYPRQKIAGQP